MSLLIALVRTCRIAAQLPSKARLPTTRLAQSSTATASMSTLKAQFDKAIQAVPSAPSATNEDKLQLYALFKQATTGRCTTDAPGRFDFVARAKWNAWNELGQMSSEEAMKKYIAVAEKLLGRPMDSPTPIAAEAAATTTGAYSTILTEESNGLFTIKFNRPQKKNAFTVQSYEEVMNALGEAAKNPNVRVVMLTGEGDTYSSGNDLSNFTNIPPEGPAKMAADAKVLLQRYVGAFIHFPKLLVAAVNGPAIGISVTVLGLFDLVYASDTATFHTPFTALGQSPEGCSSYVFPRIMGPARANAMLLAGKKFTAEEAERAGLLTQVIPHDQFRAEIEKIATGLAALPKDSMRLSRGLTWLRQPGVVEELDRVNKEECEILEKRWLSDECMNAIMQFMSRKK